MSNSKQTAMDWFLENLKEYSTPSIIEIDWDEFNQLFDQAKEMEKEQIENSFIEGANTIYAIPKTFDEYYKQTYGGNNE
jgi:hypothetical protein